MRGHGRKRSERESVAAMARSTLMPVAVLLAALAAACLVAMPLGSRMTRPSAALGLELAPSAAGTRMTQGVRVAPGQVLVGGTETYPYWERENTGDPEAFANDYIDLCIRKLYPEVGCPGGWDSRSWSPIRDTYDEDHPELDIWPPE